MENLLTLNHGKAGPVRTRPRVLALLRLALVLVLCPAGAAEPPTNAPAHVTISGFGFLGNREMLRLLKNFQPNEQLPPVIDRTFVEDAALVLLARAHDEGYLRATLTVNFKMTDGSKERRVWTNVMDTLLPRDFAAQEVRFRLRGGRRFYYQKLAFHGVKAFSRSEAESYFVSSDVMLRLRANRVFSPAGLNSSLAALREAYARAGYQNAVITTNRVTLDEHTGAVSVEIGAREGLPTIVRSVRVRVMDENQNVEPEKTLESGKPYSRFWQQRFTHKLQTAEQVKGFPDTSVQFTPLGRETNAGNIQLDLLAVVSTGPFVRVGKVVEQGNTNTRPSVVNSRIKVKPGEPLNVVEAEKSRQSLARLGVFDSVRLRYEPVDEDTRNVIYEFKDAKPVSLSVLAGYGSYELLRGGLEFENRNVFGLAHDLQVRGIQSFKSTSGDLLYTIPEAFGDNVSVFGQGSGLHREEVTFTREEYGGSVGFKKVLVPIKTDFSIRYDYEWLRALNLDTNAAQVGTSDATSAAIVFELNHDTLDNPVMPQHGMKLFTRVEIASTGLGGTVDYQRLQYGGSEHIDLGGGRLLHLGLLQGVTYTLGGTSDQLPFNKRFFPGGANSVRGYQEGEASPLDSKGKQLGAETFTQGNIEFEQIVIKSWSVVAFLDSVGIAKDRTDYPWDQFLSSAGGGVNWRSLIGPVRVEYGYNLNRRPHDPAGTLQLSIGFPF